MTVSQKAARPENREFGYISKHNINTNVVLAFIFW